MIDSAANANSSGVLLDLQSKLTSMSQSGQSLKIEAPKSAPSSGSESGSFGQQAKPNLQSEGKGIVLDISA
ncbi:hypothetical protein QGN29_08265 [Temperatibacter marinus]|uniref:Uncharacterized protein n=1 Tax=Temperatibacter marinus TaxID=1456591 RepID=A0AA52H8K5_9PROT|nr:hypothetical protein [Temperatibacter marinus]WND01552.1 hypothetical protein QGN29_08265 [Temperatibacter marinus]